VQIPFNLLDSRWLADEFQATLVERPTVTIHARSVFLQGLLINSDAVWPTWFRRSKTFVAKIKQLCADLERQSPADLCIAYVAGHPWVATMVLGVERLEQIEELLGLASKRPLTHSEIEHVTDTFSSVPARLLNPAKW
jgi:aryl-alcohol dehydrogenase-like predicted oxidoreductase